MARLTLQANNEDAGVRIDAWLAASVEGLTRSAAARLLETGQVTCGGKKPAKNYKLTGGETVEVVLPEPEPVEAVAQDITAVQALAVCGLAAEVDETADAPKITVRLSTQSLSLEEKAHFQVFVRKLVPAHLQITVEEI